ncbi:MAG: glutamyl-tRNA reductase [Acidobacteriota bacterium]|jgi:glutamyl-tRNA reductase|nr:glutamyl-tRNA reductase [Acidobacteriota bacterium]
MDYLVLTGLNHRTAPLDIRQKAAFGATCLPEALHTLQERTGALEAAILSTCNRVEIIATVADQSAGIAEIERFLAESSGIEPGQMQGVLYRHYGDFAIRHVFRVASSLDSMILGEPQILGQVKSCYSAAVEAQTVGSRLNGLFQTAFRAAKRVRTETGIGEYPVSAGSAAVELARKIYGDLGGKSVLIVGAGEMGETAVRHLSDSGAGSITVTNRSFEAARDLAEKFHGAARPFEELCESIARADIVLTSTGAPDILVGPGLVREIRRGRKNDPMVFIDISVPRNVDPAVAGIDGVFCYDVDDLASVVEANLAERVKAAAAAEKIIDHEVHSFSNKLRAVKSAPVAMQIQGRIEEICQAELERCLHRMGTLPPKAMQELEAMTSRIAAKIAHPLLRELRDSQDSPSENAYTDLLTRLFTTKDAK